MVDVGVEAEALDAVDLVVGEAAGVEVAFVLVVLVVDLAVGEAVCLEVAVLEAVDFVGLRVVAALVV